MRLDAEALGLREVEHLYGDATATIDDGGLELSADEASIGIHRLFTTN